MTIFKHENRVGDYVRTQYMNEDYLYHRVDGPAYVRQYDDGTKREEWWYNGDRHRYGGPSIITRTGICYYTIHGNSVENIVWTWLDEHGYEWETMSEQEKWELELFMRSLG